VSPLLLSYAQRFEDLYLLRCFPDQASGFYIDVGSGHPVYDNVSFGFYLKGWSGIAVEPNPRLAALTSAVRPRDRMYQGIIGAERGEVDFYLVDEFHGFSTGIVANANAALDQFGKSSKRISVSSTTLAALCAEHAPNAIDFLKVDVEGAETNVLMSGDWAHFRPKIVVVEALAPFTQAPAWGEFEPFLTEQGYQYVWFDSLNRYYLANEARQLARHFEDGPIAPERVELFRDAGRALERPSHPDHHLARLLAAADMADLPLHDPILLVNMLTEGMGAAELGRKATPADLQGVCGRVFGRDITGFEARQLALPEGTSLQSVYAQLVDSDVFRTACGRIAAGYAW
jgi:FkbM family methyltransferase